MNKLRNTHIYLPLLAALLLCLAVPMKAQEFPEPMEPPRMVNDFAGFLEPQSAASLERKLQDFYFKTSTQIYIISVGDLHGYDPGDYAARIGEKWGVGTKGKDNGAVILIKPKTPDSRGEVFISTGYGLEGAVPDVIANRIVDNEIIPLFKEGDNYGGLNQAVDVLISLTEGEFTADEYVKQTSGSKGFSIGGIILLIIIIIALFGGGKSGRHNHLGGNLPFWILLSMMGSGSRSHGGAWGGFSGGGGIGGFGGGGGGSFGGGGAGGSW